MDTALDNLSIDEVISRIKNDRVRDLMKYLWVSLKWDPLDSQVVWQAIAAKVVPLIDIAKAAIGEINQDGRGHIDRGVLEDLCKTGAIQAMSEVIKRMPSWIALTPDELALCGCMPYKAILHDMQHVYVVVVNYMLVYGVIDECTVYERVTMEDSLIPATGTLYALTRQVETYVSE